MLVTTHVLHMAYYTALTNSMDLLMTIVVCAALISSCALVVCQYIKRCNTAAMFAFLFSVCIISSIIALRNDNHNKPSQFKVCALAAWIITGYLCLVCFAPRLPR